MPDTKEISTMTSESRARQMAIGAALGQLGDLTDCPDEHRDDSLDLLKHVIKWIVDMGSIHQPECQPETIKAPLVRSGDSSDT